MLSWVKQFQPQISVFQMRRKKSWNTGKRLMPSRLLWNNPKGNQGQFDSLKCSHMVFSVDVITLNFGLSLDADFTCAVDKCMIYELYKWINTLRNFPHKNQFFQLIYDMLLLELWINFNILCSMGYENILDNKQIYF